MSKFIDITGQRFGKLVATKRVNKINQHGSYWLCKCDCGNECIVATGDLRSGNTKSCGCQGGVLKDLTGMKFGRLTVLQRVENDKKGNARFLCQCICDNTIIVLGWCLSTGRTRSCGCLQKECVRNRTLTHGDSNGGLEYSKWLSMKSRCLYQSSDQYHNYGARGIKICDRWINSYENFLKDMGRCPLGLTLERIDTNGNYEPSNCKWATIYEQAGNRRNNRLLTFNGRTQIMMDWVREWGIARPTLYRNLKKGRTMEEIFNLFVKKGGN